MTVGILGRFQTVYTC